ncbi:4-hydroxy-tetrahydrodipicolinate reductase [Flavobacterium sp. JP2137]|uniref:4-hydroxy-tetrahydrodipicolinate reductase n=1 Tax=Flavobacterium sp. JP2137 TaxID=3414510 RepID=UPI003D2FB7DB
MKIALLGYGKMGQIIEKIALERGHQIVLKKTSTDTYDRLEHADVAIDFSVPTAAVANIQAALDRGIPVISGTTGWLADYQAVCDYCLDKRGAFLYGSNFSVGVNLFFQLNAYLAELMAPLQNYTAEIEEIHHTQKLDAPSGTAISLAQGIINNSSYTQWTLNQKNTAQDLPIFAKRIDQVPGTHTVSYSSAIDTIEIKHTAHNRNGFALGAVIAAEWIFHKKGIFSMKDVLNLKK